MNRLAVIFSLSIIFLFSCSSTPKNDPLSDIVGENKIGYVQTSCMQNPDNGPRMVSRQDKHEYLNRDDYFDCVDRTSASIEAQNEEERFSLKTEMHFLEMVIRNMVAHEMIDKDKILKCYCGQHAVFNCVELESFWNYQCRP